MAIAERRYGLYIGAGAAFINTDAIDAFEQDVNFQAGEIIGGSYWRWLGIEVRRGTSFEDETVNLGNDPDTNALIVAESRLDDYQSQYLRLQFANDVARIYGLYGNSTVNTTAVFSDQSFNRLTSSGASYGLGAGVDVSEHLAFNLEYRVLLSSEDNTFSMLGMNVDFRF